MNAELTQILQAFGVDNALSCTHITHGLINITYVVSTPKDKYILQRLNTIFSKQLIDNQKILLPFLQQKGFCVSELIPTPSADWCIFHEGYTWRMQKYIENEPTKMTKETVAQAAKMLAKFHAVGKDAPMHPACTIENFHNTSFIIGKLKQTFKEHLIQAKVVQEEFTFLTTTFPFSNYCMPVQEKTLLHGDPKFNNFLFKNNKLVGLVDLDTLMWENPLIDLGDALSSWCRKGEYFDKELFTIATQAYEKENPALDSTLFVAATLLITLELAARFLTDYFEQRYFQWNEEKYATAAQSHLASAQELIAYYKNIQTALQ